MKKRINNSLLAVLCLVLFASFINADFDKNATFIQADALFANKYYEQAIKLYQQIIDNDIENVTAIVKLGYCYFYISKKEKAVEMFEKAYKITGKDFYKQLVELSSKQTEKQPEEKNITVNKNSLKDFYFGANAGVSYPQADPKTSAWTSMFVVVGGFNIEYYLVHDILALRLEINYLIVNESFTFEEWDGPWFSQTQYASYPGFQIPLLIKASLPLDMPIRPYISFGPTFESERELSWMSSDYINYSGVSEMCSLILGVGTDYILENGSFISAELRADWTIYPRPLNTDAIFTFTLGYSI